MIRLASEEDWPMISRVSRRSGYEDYINHVGPEYLKDGRVMVYEDTEIRGFLKMEYLPDESAWLGGLRVDPDSWRKGIGSSLTLSAIEQAQSEGRKTVRLLIYEDNVRSLNLAEKQGFERIASYDFYDGLPEVTGFSRTETKASGLVNVGWKFMIASPENELHAEQYELNGWTFVATNERTFQISSTGDTPVLFGEGGFTCARSDIGPSPFLEKYREKDFSTGYVLEKKL